MQTPLPLLITQAAMNILIIEDDLEAAALLQRTLHEHGYELAHAADGRDGLERALRGKWDLIIADRMLPSLDGLAIIEQLRARGTKTPILILSALGNVDDRVHGLKAGGDDYLTKPYASAELLARVEALLRRGQEGAAASRLSDSGVVVDLLTRTAERDTKPLQLTAREFDVLVFLMQHARQVVTRKMLLEQVWDLHFDPQTNVIDVHMSRLRQALDRGFTRALIHTIRGTGYMFGE
jgi:two-component system OmpR family response regulator